MGAQVEFNMEDFKKRQRAAKIQAALDALKTTTPGDWWVDDRGDIHNDPVGTVCIGMIGDGAPLWYKSNCKVIAASRELAEEVLRLREMVRDAYRAGHCDGGDAGSWFAGWESSTTKTDLEAGQ